MSTHDPAVYLAHILESIETIEQYTAGMSEEAFLATSQVQDAVVRRLEIIGEAVKNLSGEFRDAHPEVPWKRLAGLRDVLIHQYATVDVELTWEMVQDQLPALKGQITRILEGDL